MVLIKKYFGTIKWYDKQKEFGYVQCHEIGDISFKPINLADDTDINLLSKNTLVLFSVKKIPNGKNIADHITIDYINHILINYTKFDNKVIDVLLSYANSDAKDKLQSLIKNRNFSNENFSNKYAVEFSQTNLESDNLDFLEAVLTNNDMLFCSSLIKNLAEGLGSIKNENAFESAKKLISYNKPKQSTEEFYYRELPLVLYQKSNVNYKFKLWLENCVSFCDLNIIRRKFEKADIEVKNQILQRCNADERGFLINEDVYQTILNLGNDGTEEVYFESIQDNILKEIHEAKESIFVAVAWFTNHHFLDALCSKLQEGVNVEIIILNDYINNWVEGLDFQKFIELGNETGKGTFYFCGMDNIMHHKFCIIDRKLIFNGSYNWTYYAEHRNYENCMMFRNKPDFIEKFIMEFEKIKKLLSPVEKVIPFDRESSVIYDLLSVRQYRSKDLEYQAKEARNSNNTGLAANLVHLSLQINPENEEALKFQREINNIDEETIRKNAIDQELKEKDRKQVELNIQIDEQKRQIEAGIQEEKDRNDRESKEKAIELKQYQALIAKQDAERQMLIKEEEDLKAKQELEERDKRKLAEIQRNQQLLLEKQDREKNERERKQIQAEQLRIEEVQHIEEERRTQAGIIAQIEAKKRKIEEEARFLEEAKNTALQGLRGKLRINLQWKSIDDLDLHVYDPDENHIHYASKTAICQNSQGKLDVDANAQGTLTAIPQENIFWENSVPEGIYRVEVEHYTYRLLNPCPFVVTIIPEFGEAKVYQGQVNGRNDISKVATFSYSSTVGLKILTSI